MRAFLLALLLPAAAHAASCCGSVLAQMERLGPCENAAFQLQAGFADTRGTSGPSGSYVSNGAGVRDLEGRLRLGGALRVSEELQLGVGAGWAQGFRRFGTDRSSAGWFTDTQLTARWDPAFQPRLGLTGTLTLPTARAVEESHDPFAADATGRAAAMFRGGVTWETLGTGPYLIAGAGFLVRAPSRTGLDAGWGADASVTGGTTVESGIALSAGVSASFISALAYAGTRLPDSAATRVVLTAGAGVPVGELTSVTLSVALDPPVSQLARNTDAQLAAVVGLRRALD